MSAERAIGGERDASPRDTPHRQRSRRRDLASTRCVKIGLVLLVTVLAVLYLVPLYWLFVTSIKVPARSTRRSRTSCRPISFLSWRRILDHPFAPKRFVNSVIVATIATAGAYVCAHWLHARRFPFFRRDFRFCIFVHPSMPWGFWRFEELKWQRKAKTTAFAQLAFHPHPATMRLDKLLANAASSPVLSPGERFDPLCERVQRYVVRLPPVGHRDPYPARKR